MNGLNLLFLYTDQQRFDTLAAYGNDKIKMPNLNRLSQQSIVFDKAYVTQPVCTPSRSTLLTGQWPHTNGCLHNNIALKSDTLSIAQMLPDEYVCAHYGKWHLGDEIYAQHGFDEWLATEDMYANYYSEGHSREDRSQYWHWLKNKGVDLDLSRGSGRYQSNWLEPDLTKPGYLGEVSCDFIDRHKDAPFALFVNFLQPHTPYSTTFDDQYDPSELELPESFGNTDYATLKGHIRRARYVNEVGVDEIEWKKRMAQYWGSCTLVDKYVGKILDKVEEQGLLDKTVIVFTSDHGDMMGAHGMLHKSLMYEEAVRVPFLLRPPQQASMQHVCSPVSQIDIVPTILDLLDLPANAQTQGTSLRPCWEKNALTTDPVIVEWNPGGEKPPLENGTLPMWLDGVVSEEQSYRSYGASIRSVITRDGWKLNYSTIGEHELYCLEDDPHEVVNRFSDPSCRERIENMLGLLEQWQNQTDDTVSFRASV